MTTNHSYGYASADDPPTCLVSLPQHSVGLVDIFWLHISLEVIITPNMEEIIILAALGLLAWYWLGGVQAKELAVTVARRSCKQHGVQLLDQTVVMEKVRLRRDRRGRLLPCRYYHFEFSLDGEERRSGGVVIHAGKASGLYLDLAEYTLHEHH